MRKTYRNGALGALMDEYERVASELTHLVKQIPEDDFVRVIDAQTNNDDCLSVQAIMSHVVRVEYSYADYMREQFSLASTRPQHKLLSRQESLQQLNAAWSGEMETQAMKALEVLPLFDHSMRRS
jgi:hypothetical protein